MKVKNNIIIFILFAVFFYPLPIIAEDITEKSAVQNSEVKPELIATLREHHDKALMIIKNKSELTQDEEKEIENLYFTAAPKANGLIEGIKTCLVQSQDNKSFLETKIKGYSAAIERLLSKYDYYQKNSLRPLSKEMSATLSLPAVIVSLGMSLIEMVKEFLQGNANLEKDKKDKLLKDLEALKWPLNSFQ